MNDNAKATRAVWQTLRDLKAIVWEALPCEDEGAPIPQDSLDRSRRELTGLLSRLGEFGDDIARGFDEAGLPWRGTPAGQSGFGIALDPPSVASLVDRTLNGLVADTPINSADIERRPPTPPPS